MKTLKKVDVTPLPPSKGNIIDSFNTTDDKHKNAPSLNIVKNELDVRLKRIANNQDFNNDLNQMPLNSYANYNANTLNKPPASAFHEYGTAIKIQSASGYHLVLYGNDTVNGSDIAINSYINSAWTGWRYIGNDEALIAPKFNQSTPYDVGALVIKDKKLYLCTTEYTGTPPYPFDSCFTETKISYQVPKYLKPNKLTLDAVGFNGSCDINIRAYGNVITYYIKATLTSDQFALFATTAGFIPVNYRPSVQSVQAESGDNYFSIDPDGSVNGTLVIGGASTPYTQYFNITFVQ